MIQSQYSETTGPIKVTIFPIYLETQSDPQKNQYIWAYHVYIENRGTEKLRLKTRYWKIIDALGHVQEVRGDGVVGEEPELLPGKNFEYTSATPLSTPSGIMVGSYTMQKENGEFFDVAIPAFSLDSPYQSVTIN